jgi:hypothetical protein
VGLIRQTRSKRRSVSLFLPGLAVLFALTGVFSGATAQTAVLRVAGPEQVVAPAETFHCGDPTHPDFPDSPVHAYRAADGTIGVFAVNQSNFPLVADSPIEHISQPDCTSMFVSAHNDDPALFSDRTWLNAPYTLDGTHVIAVTHIEYHGLLHDRYRNVCAAKGDRDISNQTCWYSATGLVTSSDEGKSFTSAGLVAALPYKFDPSMVRVGVSNASNILRNPHDGNYYIFLHAFAYGAQASGECILRSPDLQHWRAWDGRDFSVTFVNPYDTPGVSSAGHVCAPVFAQGVFFTVVYSAPLNLFLATVRGGTGFHCVTSPDLIHWSVLSAQTEFFDGHYPRAKWSGHAQMALYPSPGPTGDNLPTMYPSLIDPQSPSRNFDTVGDHPYLYLVRRFSEAGGDDDHKSEIVRIPLRVEKL